MRIDDNVVIELNGSEITNDVIEYTRTQQVCNGIGTLELSVPESSGLDFDPWDIIEIWEYGDKVGKFYVSESKESARAGIIVVSADDGSKLITDYFLTETYQSDVLTYSRYWIQRILDEATVSYDFNVGSDQGGPVNPNTSFGLDSAYNLIQGLLQQSGWYLYFNPNGTAIIGKINKGLNDPDHTIDDSNILNFNRERDDARLRNRAVVWGNANPLIGEQVFVDITMPSPYQIDSDDERTVVLANSSIYSNAVGVDLAYKMLNEFKDIKDEKVIQVASNKNFKIGDVIRVESDYWTGSGLLTTLEAYMGENGLVHTLTLNEKCPRLFAYFGLPLLPVSGFYVYVGTEANGVWKKWTEGSTWYDTSYGLGTDLNVTDLFIKDDIYACVTSGGYLYTKTSDLSSWSKYSHPSLRDRSGITYSAPDIKAKACSINDIGNIVVGYDTATASGELISTSAGRSWVLEVSPTHKLIKAEQVVTSNGNKNLGMYDLESAGEFNIVSISGIPISGYSAEAIGRYREGGLGISRNQGSNWSLLPGGLNDFPENFPDGEARIFGPPPGYTTSNLSLSGSDLFRITGVICDEDLNYWFATYNENVGRVRFYKIDPTLGTVTYDEISSPGSEWANFDNIHGALVKTGPVLALTIFTGEDYTLNSYTYTHTVGTSIMDQVSSDLDFSDLLTTVIAVGSFGGDKVGILWTDDSGRWARVYDPQTGLYNEYNMSPDAEEGQHVDGSTISLAMFGMDDYGIFATFYVAFVNPESDLWCPFGLGYLTRYKAAKIFVKYLKFGRENGLGLATVADLEPDEGPDMYSANLNLSPNLGSIYNALELSFNRGWTFLTANLGTVDHVCFPIDVYYKRFDLGIDLPSFTGHQLTPGTIDFDLLSFTASRSYSPYGIVVKDGIVKLVDEQFRVHASQPLTNYSFLSYQDDVDGCLYAVSNFSGNEDKLFGFSTGLSLVKTVDFGGNLTNPWISQNFIIDMTVGGARLRYLDTDWINSIPLGGEVFKHTSIKPLGITASDSAEIQSWGQFDTILYPPEPVKIEISKGSPTVAYSIPSGVVLQNSFFAATTSNGYGTWYSHVNKFPTYDARVVDLLNPGEFPVTSGVFDPEDFQRFISFATPNGWAFSNYQFGSNWTYVASGLISHIESSNYTPYGPYLFYSTSGVVANRFMQKSPLSGLWQDFTISLPGSEITIIRCDDQF